MGTLDDVALRTEATGHNDLAVLGERFPHGVQRLPDRVIDEAAGVVITSYSIHYTKLYEAMERVEIPSGVPLVYRFGRDLSVLGRQWLELGNDG